MRETSILSLDFLCMNVYLWKPLNPNKVSWNALCKVSVFKHVLVDFTNTFKSQFYCRVVFISDNTKHQYIGLTYLLYTHIEF